MQNQVGEGRKKKKKKKKKSNAEGAGHDDQWRFIQEDNANNMRQQ